jgi:hypothetical protein
VNDARAVGAALRDMGFATDVRVSATMIEMEQAADRFLAGAYAGDVSLKIVILDACRDNPYIGDRGIGGGGLAPMRAGKSTYIAIATGQTADNNASGANGLFTSAPPEGFRDSPAAGAVVDVERCGGAADPTLHAENRRAVVAGSADR